MTQVQEFRKTRRAVANAKLDEFRRQCWRLAILSRRGIVDRIAAVDLLYEVAIGHALVRALGEARIEAILAEAFAGANSRSGGGRMSGDLDPHQDTLLYQSMRPLMPAGTALLLRLRLGLVKTKIAAYRLRRIQAASKRAIFIVPALSLIDQTVEMLWAEGVRDVGVIQADHILYQLRPPDTGCQCADLAAAADTGR